MDRNITNFDIKKIFKTKCKIVNYKSLPTKNNNYLNKLFNRGVKYIFILYEYKINYGHWTVILETKSTSGGKTAEFFDPYGAKPDSYLMEFTTTIKNKYGMEYPKVVNMLLEYSESHKNKSIEYNNYPLQSKAKGINTCGRWCVLRCFLSIFDIDQFYNLFKNKKNKDYVVMVATDAINL